MGPFLGNLRSQIVRKKKIYSIPDNWNDMGVLWEYNLVTRKLKMYAYNGFFGNNYFWRSKAHVEKDHIEEIDGKLIAYEFKWNLGSKSNPPQALWNNLIRLKKVSFTRKTFGSG